VTTTICSVVASSSKSSLARLWAAVPVDSSHFITNYLLRLTQSTVHSWLHLHLSFCAEKRRQSRRSTVHTGRRCCSNQCSFYQWIRRRHRRVPTAHSVDRHSAVAAQTPPITSVGHGRSVDATSFTVTLHKPVLYLHLLPTRRINFHSLQPCIIIEDNA